VKVKYIISVLIFFMLFSPSAKAQDTIVLNSGKKILAKHVHIRKKIYYTHFEGHYRRDDSVEKSEVNYVVHKSGWVIPMIAPPWYAPVTITPAIGLSTMPFLFRSFLGDSGSNIKSYSPVYILNIDYSSNSQFSVGFGIAWQSVKINPYVSYTGNAPPIHSFNPLFPKVTMHSSPTIYYPPNILRTGLPSGGPDDAIVESLTRLNIGIRMLYHFRNDDEEDFYFGTRIGLSFWTDQSNPAGFNSLSSLTNLSVQAIVGIRKELTDVVGINFEGGIGAPYQIQAGIYFKVNTKKK
jgi:hypothetical protein